MFTVGVAIAACGDDGGTPQPDIPPPSGIAAVQIKTLSNRADLVSGGDVLVEIVVPAGAPMAALHVAAGARDVSTAFARRDDGRVLGLVTGLANGPVTITADLGGKGAAGLTVTNHPIGGPVFSGAQIQPWICAAPTAQAEAGDQPARRASGLSTPAVDAQCNIASEVKLYYRTTTAGCTLSLPDPNPPTAPPVNGCFKAFDPASPAPADLAMTTTDAGVTVPYIVRVERGTLNRGIYDIAVLHDPARAVSPTAPATPWNRKLLYVFGAATGQPRLQQRSTQSWAAQDEALKRGFLVAQNSMTDSSLNSNRVSMTETLMMMKEHIGDSYGEILYAMGAGCSGGSINQLTASSIYPGLLDGIQPSCTYSDAETTGIEVADCELLVRFYASDAWKGLMAGKTVDQDQAKQAAINGHLDHRACRAWFNAFIGVARPGNYHSEAVDANGVITAAATTINNCALPASMIYDRATKPDGIRCTGADHAASIWGKLPDTNRAPSTRDNVGVVYGHKAYLDGAIDGEEFVTLNESIGGADFDVVRTQARSVADDAALDIAYQSGIVTDGHQLARTAIIDLRGFDDQGIHLAWRSSALRARLDAANGGHDNHVLWRFGTGLGTGLTPLPASGLTLASFLTMDKWLAAMRADTSDAAIDKRVLATKPADGFDFCYLTADTTFQTKVRDAAACDADARLKARSSPRQVAGGPITEDIFKCQLEPFDAGTYPELTAAQQARLAAVFSGGVCDWSKPGVGQARAQAPRSFTAGPGGVPIAAAAPVSRAL